MTDGERIIALQRRCGLLWKDLAERIGLASTQTLTDIRNGRHGISTRLANRILEEFPYIRREWLVLGTGAMTNEEESAAIPLLNNVGLANNSESIIPSSIFPQAEAAYRVTDNSMDEYPLGAVLLLKRVGDINLLIPGKNYVVETKEFTLAKRLQNGSKDDTIALYSTNKETYPDGKLIHEPFQIPLESVERIFAIVGYVYVQSSEISSMQ